MTQQINIPDDTYFEVKNMLASQGDRMGVDEYVTKTLSRDLFFKTVRNIKAQTKDVDPEQLDAIIEDAVEAVRAERRKPSPGADRT